MAAPSRYRPRRVRLRDGREVTVRAIAEADAPEIVQAFERLSDDSRYFRFMQHKNELADAMVQRGVHPRSGRDAVFVATIPAADGIDIVGAVQYVGVDESQGRTCEFAVTVAEDWRNIGLATTLLRSLIRRARRDGYATLEGLVMAENSAMLEVARKLHFETARTPGDATLLRVYRTL